MESYSLGWGGGGDWRSSLLGSGSFAGAFIWVPRIKRAQIPGYRCLAARGSYSDGLGLSHLGPECLKGLDFGTSWGLDLGVSECLVLLGAPEGWPPG